jgi:hypothetical protein
MILDCMNRGNASCSHPHIASHFDEHLILTMSDTVSDDEDRVPS